MSKKQSQDIRETDFWAGYEQFMKEKQAQYNQSVNMNSGGEGWNCLSLRE